MLFPLFFWLFLAVVLMLCGKCPFAEMVQRAWDAGAAAVIVGNSCETDDKSNGKSNGKGNGKTNGKNDGCGSNGKGNGESNGCD